MGTNYVFRFNACLHCQRWDEAHIGKQSTGWSFLFHALEHKLLNDGHPEWGLAVESPFGYPVRSRADWLRVLAEVPGTVVNEYGVEVHSPVAWLAGLMPPTEGQQRAEDAASYYARWMEPTGWRDPEGFRFEPREFS